MRDDRTLAENAAPDPDDLEHFALGEVDARLMATWANRGPLYRIYSDSLLTDYGGPAFAKLSTTWGSPAKENDLAMPENAKVVLRASLTLSSYVMLGFETGIANQFVVLREYGMSKEQTMELVMLTQLYSGMRGLGQVYRAIGDLLPAFAQPAVPLELPDGWGADPEAFRAGLDLSRRDMTVSDVKNLTDWYERTIGYLPDSIAFGLKYHPEFVKVNRAKWEVAIRTLPKQFAPLLMVRQGMLANNPDGVREATLLGKAWGMAKEQIVMVISSSVMYFTSFEGYYTAARSVDDVLSGWGA